MAKFNSYEEFENHILEWQDRSNIDFDHIPTPEEKEHMLFVRMCYIMSWDKKAWDITPEEWKELENFWMVRSEKWGNGIDFYITEKALQYVEWVDESYKKLVDWQRASSNCFWTLRETPDSYVTWIQKEVKRIIDWEKK